MRAVSRLKGFSTLMRPNLGQIDQDNDEILDKGGKITREEEGGSFRLGTRCSAQAAARLPRHQDLRPHERSDAKISDLKGCRSVEVEP